MAGWEIPLSYGNPIAEHLAVRKTAGLIDQSHRGKLRLTGRDSASFLNGMVTNDISNLAPGAGLYAAITSDKAKMLSDARIYSLADAIWLDLEPGLAGKIYHHLDKYVIAADVTIEDLSLQIAIFSVYGPASLPILQRFRSGFLPSTREYGLTAFDWEGQAVFAARNEITGEEGYDLFIPMDLAATVWSRLLEAGAPLSLVPVGLTALESLRIEAGIPRYGIDMDESNFPMEAGLEKTAISYTKGCYIGQETIARADARGQMNRHLAGVALSGDSVPAAGTPIHAVSFSPEAKPIGTVTGGVKSPTLGKVIALGYLHRDHIKHGSIVIIDTRPATVTALPFYKRPG